MKNLKRLTALLLALCLCLSVFPVASAAGIAEDGQAPVEEAPVEVYETYEPSGAETLENVKVPTRGGCIEFTFDEDGTMTITGNGRIAPFTSAEDQPWAGIREDIRNVRFDHSSHMEIASLAYWFAGCVNLESCEVPAFAELGTDAFRDCAKLETLMLYHNSEVPVIAETAFQCTDGAVLTIVVLEDIICEALTSANFYGRDVEIMVRPPIDAYAVCGIADCNCSSCSWYNDYEPYDEERHYKWEVCDSCSASEYHIRSREAHSFNSRGVCTKCGYEEACSHYNTSIDWYGCDWEETCDDCGELIDWGTTHGTYSYGSWEYYTSTQHRRYGTCNDCGEGKYQYGSHSTTTKYEKYSDAQHSINNYCSICASNVGTVTYGNHNFTYSTCSAGQGDHPGGQGQRRPHLYHGGRQRRRHFLRRLH